MRRTPLLNAEVSQTISKLGHYDALTICDAGLPIPNGPQRIDLALTRGIPSFMDTVKIIIAETEIEAVELANEFKEVSPKLHSQFISFIKEIADKRGKAIKVGYVSHDDFKKRTRDSVAVVRTGEFTPYANVTLKSGVVF